MDRSRIEREQAYHDDRYTHETRQKAHKYYGTAIASERYYRKQVASRKWRRALEIGSGLENSATTLAERGIPVTAIDISQVAIDRARQSAQERGLTIDHKVMNAEELDFPEGAFDLVCGTGILHHLDLEPTLSALSRVLAPDGLAVFKEPLGHNPAINLYRRMTPSMRTPDEHPLLMADIENAGRWFDRVDMEVFTLTSLFATPLGRGKRPALQLLETADRVLFRAVPYLRKHAWIAVVTLHAPRQSIGIQSGI